MELLRGRTLRLELQQRGRLTAERAGRIVQGVCAAVAAAHERRVVHRDLKPENIFLTEAAGAEVAKVLDFGLAKPVALNEETVTLADTAPGVLVGTVKYMSPEQLRGGPPDESWDLWALAVLVYEMLTGGYPFPPAAAADWRHAIVAGRILPARTHVREAPETWDVFFSLVLAADVHLRPSSAARFAAAFQELVGQS
jgi:serine/threonine-protein kinase